MASERQQFAAEVRGHRKAQRAIERQAERERLAYEHGRMDFGRREQVDRCPYRNPALVAHYRRGWDAAREGWERWQAGRELDAYRRALLRERLAQVRAECDL